MLAVGRVIHRENEHTTRRLLGRIRQPRQRQIQPVPVQGRLHLERVEELDEVVEEDVEGELADEAAFCCGLLLQGHLLAEFLDVEIYYHL